MMEEIKVNLPRFDQCISLLRTEIDELKAGKLDHRLREVAAIPLIDPSLHSALSKAIDGGLLLPPAPDFSDSEDERIGDEENEDATEAKEAEDGGEEEEEDGAAYADGKGAAAGGGVASGGEQEGEGDNEARAWAILGEESHQPGGERNSSGTQRRGNERGGLDRENETIPTSTVAPSKSKDRTREQTEWVAEANGLTLSVVKPPEDENSDSFSASNGPQVKSNGSPLRDRPPILSGGGSRAAPAAPPPTPQPPPSSQRANSGVIGGSEGQIDSDRGDGIEGGGRVEDDRGHDGIGEEDEGGTGSGILRVAGGAAPSVIPEMKSAKKKPGGDDSVGEMNGKEATKGKRGRKRPRAAESASSDTSPRFRRPRPKRQDEIPGPGEESDEDGEETEGRDRAPDDTDRVKRESADDPVEVEHFRRIALEVWDRVYKHKFAIIFRKPVNPKDAPGYEKVIRKPMDLGLIKQRIISGALICLDDLSRDLFVMCNNAMVFNGKGDPYFDYSKELRTFASDIISEARRPGFVTADPGFDSIVAGTRTSRARQPSPSPAAPSQSAPRGRVNKKRQSGAGSVGGRRSSRESDSASVADDTEDEGSKGRQRGDQAGDVTNDAKRDGKRLSVASRAKGKKIGGRRGSKNHASSEVESVGGSIVGVISDEDDDGDGRHQDDGDSASYSKSPSEGGAGRKRTAVGKGKSRAKGLKGDRSDEDRSARGKGRRGAKAAARRTQSSKAGASKKRAH